LSTIETAYNASIQTARNITNKSPIAYTKHYSVVATFQRAVAYPLA